jgi:hypothetical protein
MIRAQRPDAQNTRPPLEAKPPLEAIRLPCFFYQKSIGFRVRPPGIHTTLEVIMTMTTSRRAVLAGAAALAGASAPIAPQIVQTMRGPNAGTGTLSGVVCQFE